MGRLARWTAMNSSSSSPRIPNDMSSRSTKSKRIRISPKVSESLKRRRTVRDRISFSAQEGERMKTENAESVAFDPNSVRKVVSVQAPQAVAWRAFNEKMGARWPLAYYKVVKAKPVHAV